MNISCFICIDWSSALILKRYSNYKETDLGSRLLPSTKALLQRGYNSLQRQNCKEHHSVLHISVRIVSLSKHESFSATLLKVKTSYMYLNRNPEAE